MTPKSITYSTPLIATDQPNKNGRVYGRNLIKDLTVKAGQMMAKELEKKMFDEITKSLGIPDIDTTASGSTLTPEMLEDTMKDFIGKPNTPETQLQIRERVGAAIINQKGIARAKAVEDPRITDVIVMRQFTELGKPFSEEDLQGFVSNAVGQRFDVDWLCDKYSQEEPLELFRNKGKEFIVQEASIDYWAYAHKQMEKAVYATGVIVDKGVTFGQSPLMSANFGGLPIGKVQSVNFNQATGEVEAVIEMEQPIERISIDISLSEGDKK